MKTKKLIYTALFLIFTAGLLGAQEKISVPQMTDIQKQQRLNWMGNYCIIVGANYAKAQGKSVEHYAKHFGEVAKTTWDPKKGFTGFINGTLNNWVSFCSSASPAIEITFQSDNKFVFKAPLDIKNMMAPEGIHGVSFDELMTTYRIIFEEIGKYHNCLYAQKLVAEGNWIEITITNK
jgi:hypothetical protein